MNSAEKTAPAPPASSGPVGADPFHALLESAGHALLLLDHGVIRECNHRGAQLLGLPPERLLDRGLADFGPATQPNGHPSAEMLDLQAREALAGRGAPFTWRAARADGTPMDLCVTLASGAPGGGLFASLRELPAGAAGEDLLRLTQARFQALAEQSDDAFELLDEAGAYLDANSAACRQLGYTRAELLQRRITDVDPLLTPEKYAARLRVLVDGGVEKFESLHRRKDGSTFPVEVTVSVSRVGGGLQALAVVHDITRRRQAEEELLQIARGVSATTGVEFFRTLALHLARLLEVDFVEVAEVDGPAMERARTLAVVADGALQPDFAYDLAGTPCNEVAHRRTCGYPSGVQASFPTDHLLAQMGVDAYVGTPLFSATGEPLGLIAAMHRKPLKDLARVENTLQIFAARAAAEMARERAEQALRASEAFRRRVFDASRVPTVVLDPETLRFIDGNPAAVAAHGVTSTAQLLGLTVLQVSAPHQADGEPTATRMRACLDRAMAEGAVTFEWRFQRPDGCGWDGEVHAVTFQSGNRLLLQCTILDVTQRHQDEETLRKLHLAVEQSKVSVVITDASGIIEYVSPGFSETTGYAPQDAVGRNPRFLKSDRTPPEEHERLWKTITRGEQYRGTLCNRTRDGRLVWESARISPVRNAAGVTTHYLAVMEDITDQRKLAEQLRQAQKMEVVGQLAGGIAHDFNNMMTAMTMTLNLMQEDAADLPVTLRREIDDLLGTVNRASNLTRQLLLFSRRQTMTLQRLDLDAVLGGTEKLLARVLREDVKLTLERSPQPLWILGDPGMVEQVLLNLCANARDAMPGPGRLVIRSAGVTVDAADAERHGHGVAPGRYARVQVSDSGVGIPAELHERIFEPFFTTKEPGHGTGLGLAMVHGIIAEHRGFITVDSAPGRGTTFSLHFPIAAAQAEVAAAQAPAPAPRGRSGRILLVEDESVIRQMVARCLVKLGHEVVETTDGDDAMRAWEREQGRFDVLLTDMIMPGSRSGLDLGRALQERAPGLRVIVMSGYGAELSQHSRSRERAFLRLRKPFDIGALAGALREVLDAPAETPTPPATQRPVDSPGAAAKA